MHDLLKPVIPLTGEAMQAASAQILVGRVVAVERGAAVPRQGTTVAEVRVAITVERVIKGRARVGVVAAFASRLRVARLIAGWGRTGERLAFWGASIVGGVGATGVSDTVPASLAIGERVQVHLAAEDGRWVLPFWCALARLP